MSKTLQTRHVVIGCFLLFFLIAAFLSLGLAAEAAKASASASAAPKRFLFIDSVEVWKTSHRSAALAIFGDDKARLNAPMVSDNIVISQVYGAGNNAGAAYRNDYVELFNRGASSVSVNGWSIQYASATGTGLFSGNVTALPNVSLAPGQYFLVQLSGGTTNGVALPTPDATGTTAVAAGAGKVIVANTSTGLACNGSSTPCSPAQEAQIIDLVGFGTANYFEGSAAAPAPDTTNAIFRAAGGCTDTDQNGFDFAAAAAAPRNTATALAPCTAPLPTLSINDVSLNEGNAGTTNFTFTVSLSSPAPTGGVTFDIATADGTASSGSDYVSRSLTGQTIPEGSSSYNFDVTVNGDIDVEPDETFLVIVTNITGATAGDTQGQGTIQNDDVAQPTTTVVSLTRQNADSTNQSEVVWQIVFADAIDGLTVSNFAVVQGGTVTGAAPSGITESSGPPSTNWNISVNTGSGNGTLGLNMVNDTGLTHDVTNLPFTGEVYTIDKTAPNAPVITGSSPASPDSSTTPEIQGTAEPGSAVRLYASASCGGDEIGADFADGAGNFSINVTVAPNSSTIYTATATDGVENVSVCSNQFTYVNETPPASGDSVVNTTADTDDGSCDPLGSGTGNQDCTLREAILIANSTSGHNTISFNIPGAPGVVRTITPATQLPAITEAVTINGYSQPGSSVNTSPTGTNAVLLIEVTGAGSQNGPTAGFVILSGDSTIRGIVINRFSDGIRLNEGGNNVIAGNRIGTNATGTAAAPNNNGINVINGSNGNTIGGTAPADRNLISGNGYFNGVGLTSPSATSAPDHAFGGNGIAFNVGSGPIFNAKSAAIAEGDANLIQGNLIGTNAAGSGAIPNNDGIFIAGYTSSGIQIGGVGGRNVISGNLRYGIALEDTFFLIPFLDEVLPASVDVIRSNYIGTAADGTTPLGNQNAGISISECSNCGITFTNKADAVAVTGSTLIGGVEPGEGNVIAYNGGSGVQITRDSIVFAMSDLAAPSAAQVSATGNRISGNSIHSNSPLLIQIEATGKFAKLAPTALGLGIDLGNDGVTPNDAGDPDLGPNNLQNFPVITGATGGSPGTITGTLNTTPNTSGYQIEFFANDSCDPSGYGEGQTFLGFITTGSTDGSGDVAFLFSGANLTAGQFVTATATDPDGNTSEFSVCTEVTEPQADVTVTKETSQESVVAGENLTYTITVANDGPDTATSVELIDAIPAGTTLVLFTPPAGWTCNNIAAGGTGTFTCTNPSMANGASSIFTLVVNVDSNVPSGGQISNTATVSSPEDASGGSSTVITPVTTSAELVITKIADRATVAAGEDITYTITVSNSGPSDATSVTFADAIPAGTTLVSFIFPAGWDCNGIMFGGTGTLNCTNPLMTDGASSVFTLVVNVNSDVPSGGEISNTATVSSPEDASDGSSTVVTPVTTSADLAITKLADLETVAAGGDITYTIAVSNSGPSDASTVTLTDILPTGTTFQSLSSPAGWTCTTPAVGSGGTISCSRSSLLADVVNPPFQLVVNVPLGTASGTEISNTASVGSTTPDPNGENNSSTATTTVLVTAVSISGNVQQFNAPFANTPLQGVLITLTGTGVPSGTTRTTDAAGNYSFEDLDAGGTYTVTPSMTGKTFDPISRTYTALTTDITNANFIAYDSLTRNLRVVNGYTMPGEEATVPIVLTAQGNEAMLMFRLTYDEALLDVIDVNCGAASGVGCSVQFTAVNGVLDVTVTPASGTYAPGQKEIVTITFDTVLTDQSQTPLIFSSEGNLTTDSGGNPLATSFTNGFVVFGVGKECDVAERFTGDGLFRSDDGDVMRQMVAGLPLNWAYNEFQRADCAPFETKGDGQLDATDFQLMALTVAVLVPQQTAGGPFGPLPAPPPFAEAVSETRREMRVVSTSAGAGDRVTVSVELDAQGDETAASFTLAFDPMKLRNPQISLANGSPAGSHLTANTEKAAEGRVMMLIDSMGSLSRSTTQMVSITFDVAPSAASGETELYFTSDPTGSAISDKQARSLQTRFTGGTMTIRGSNPEGVEVSGRVFTPEGAGLRNARVVLTDEAGISRSVITNSFGYYSLEGVAPQRSYRIAVVSKRYRFTHRMVEPASNLAGVDLIAHE